MIFELWISMSELFSNPLIDQVIGGSIVRLLFTKNTETTKRDNHQQTSNNNGNNSDSKDSCLGLMDLRSNLITTNLIKNQSKILNSVCNGSTSNKESVLFIASIISTVLVYMTSISRLAHKRGYLNIILIDVEP